MSKIYRVLLLEDEEFDAELIKDALEKNNFNVVYSTDSVKLASLYLKQNIVDIVVFDLQVNNSNGLELLEYLHKNFTKKEMPYPLAVTAFTNKWSKLKLKDYQCFHISKSDSTFPQLIVQHLHLIDLIPKNKKETEEKSENAISNTSIENRIEQILTNLNISKKQQVYEYLTLALKIVLSQSEKGEKFVLQRVLESVSEEFGVQTHAVAMSIKRLLDELFSPENAQITFPHYLNISKSEYIKECDTFTVPKTKAFILTLLNQLAQTD